MAYFNNAFQKTLLSLGTSPDEVGDGTLSAALLATEGAAVTAVLNPTTFQSDYGLLAAGSNIMLAMTSVLSQDKIGPFHGGYQTTSKSKMVNPKYVNAIYQVNCCEAQTNVIGVGAIDPSGAFDATDCCRTFECDETYDLRIDLKGSPALRYLNHNMYYVASAYTGCCPDDDPTATVSSGVVMQGWINDIIHTPTFFGLYDQWDQRMINIGLIEICDDGGDKEVNLYFPDAPYFLADGTTESPEGIAFAADLVTINADYDVGFSPLSTLEVNADCCYGLIINPTAIETMFDNCTFETTDKYEIEPLIGQVSMLDQTGDPCQFEGVCLHDGITPGANGGAVLPAIRTAVQVQGSGEQVLRDFILSQSYEQNFVASNDLRIREITLGNDIVNIVPRNALYSSVYILHSVPRFNNPTGVFDNDQYLLRIILDDEACLTQGEESPAATATASQFVIDLVAWARAANNDSVADAAMVYGCCDAVTVDSLTP
tara:strand:+ start:1481 stop:2938 length:1458 start_codon:yes stop_codon:yes gene_type:complete